MFNFQSQMFEIKDESSIESSTERYFENNSLNSNIITTTTAATTTTNLEWRTLGHQVDEAVDGAEVDRGGVKRFGRNLIRYE